MPPHSHISRGLAVPSGRIARLSRLGGLASGMAGRMAIDSARAWAAGERLDRRALLLTPANAARIADELARMRGAAMKLGQLLSMEGGDVVPPELADILARLRSDAHFMPPRQLKRALAAEWGAGFPARFERFDVKPVAAASIGQVHRARTRAGQDLAVKVQYPGVRDSIDADVDNVGALVRLSGLAPRGLDLAPLLDEAKRQLHDEADYAREAALMRRYGALLADDPDFVVPQAAAELSTPRILAMSYLPGQPIDSLARASQAERDRAAELLVALTLRELFEFRLMQTDANFANYRHDPETGRIILLDFGAAREVPASTVAAYRTALRAALTDDRDGLEAAGRALGIVADDTPADHVVLLLDMMGKAGAVLRRDAAFDFKTDPLPGEMREIGESLVLSGQVATIPPMETLMVQRKLGGIYLLCARLGARVALRPLVARYL